MSGSIVKRGNRYYVIIEQRDPETGKRKRKWLSGYRTKKEADAARIEKLSNLQRGVAVDPSKITVGEFLLDEWLVGEPRDGEVLECRLRLDDPGLLVTHIYP